MSWYTDLVGQAILRLNPGECDDADLYQIILTSGLFALSEDVVLATAAGASPAHGSEAECPRCGFESHRFQS